VAPTRRRRSLLNDEVCPPSRGSRRILPDPAQGLYARRATGFPRIDNCENPHGGGPTAMRDGAKRAAVRSASTPWQLRITSFASKCRLVDRHPLYVPASAAPHVRASHYGLRLAHDSEQYDHGPKITTTDWQTRSAGDEELTTSKPGFDRWGRVKPQARLEEQDRGPLLVGEALLDSAREFYRRSRSMGR
jgi:hypothetical protein